MRLAGFLLAIQLAAAPLQVGPVSLTGSGVLTNPDWASYGGDGIGGLGLTIHASGSNANGDTVSINTGNIELYPSNDWMDWALGPLVFDASPFQCLEGLLTITSLCHATIDGISGYGSFSNLGGGIGLIDVYAILGNPGGFSGPGDLLAEAEITNTVMHVTSVVYNPNRHDQWMAQFDVVDPPAVPTPEPNHGWLVLVVAWLCIRIGRRRP